MNNLNYKNIIVTGGAGFIGSALIRKLLKETKANLTNIDKMNYASDLSRIHTKDISNSRHSLLNVDLKDSLKINKIIEKTNPDLIIHLAAESHVDRSLIEPSKFVESNIVGTFNLLQATRKYLKKIGESRKKSFRFLHVSTDEVYGSLGENGYFNEKSKYNPTSPYSSSKASSDLLVNSWFHSFGVPTLISNCSNNYGPYQYPEKLIPLTILKCINNLNIPIYGNGKNIRDWLHVDDHVDALLLIAQRGIPGQSYCVGGDSEKSNNEVVNLICKILDKHIKKDYSFSKLINYVEDRPGHDKRYAIDSTKLKHELGWCPKYKFENGLETTVKWYLNNIKWCNDILRKSNYNLNRLGLKI